MPENGLRVFGDVVLLALEQHADNAAEAASGLIGALRERAREGDDVLADQLGALLATGVIPGLRPLAVSLDELVVPLVDDQRDDRRQSPGLGMVALRGCRLAPRLTRHFCKVNALDNLPFVRLIPHFTLSFVGSYR